MQEEQEAFRAGMPNQPDRDIHLIRGPELERFPDEAEILGCDGGFVSNGMQDPMRAEQNPNQAGQNGS